MSRRQHRKDTRIDHPQVLHPIHPELRINHPTQRIPPNGACPRRMEQRICRVANIRLEIRIRHDTRAGHQLHRLKRRQCLRAHQRARIPDRLNEDLDVHRVPEVGRVGERRVERVRRRESDATARERVLQPDHERPVRPDDLDLRLVVGYQAVGEELVLERVAETHGRRRVGIQVEFGLLAEGCCVEGYRLRGEVLGWEEGEEVAGCVGVGTGFLGFVQGHGLRREGCVAGEVCGG